MKTINIKGKEYVEVNERVKEFRKYYAEKYGILSDIKYLDMEKGYVIIQASIVDNESEKVVATGLAQEYKDSSFINKTSFIENCETSAIGRALGFLGIGIDTSIASAEEVENAILQQETDSNISVKIAEALKETIKNNIDSERYTATFVSETLKKYGYEKVTDIKAKDLPDIKKELEI